MENIEHLLPLRAGNPEELTTAVKQIYGVDLAWHRPQDTIIRDWIDTSHMVYSQDGDELYYKEEDTEVVIFYTDVYTTANGTRIPEQLVKALKKVYGKSECTLKGNTIAFRVDCR